MMVIMLHLKKEVYSSVSNDIKAIETEYDGHRFRSRLEARWAVFFNAVGLTYEYEIEGFEMDGTRYLPDFYIPSLNRWFEIKGNRYNDNLLEEITLLIEALVVPDAFNMKSARIVLAFGEKHDRLWDEIYNVFEGKVPREKIDSFKAGAGTVLFLYDEATVKKMQEQFSTYADNFPVWANQANGMLQLAVWSMLRELNVGASLQHYNPVIDARVKEIFDIPENFKLVAQMPFGGIVSEPDKKEKEDIDKRVTVLR